MATKSEIGKKGEDIACDYLVKQGYKIIERNYRRPWGEIDIVCYDKDRTLIFVEVKTMSGLQNMSAAYLMPEDQMTKSKYSKTAKIAASYANANQKLIIGDRGWRIDLLAIQIDSSAKENTFHIKHYKNVYVY